MIEEIRKNSFGALGCLFALAGIFELYLTWHSVFNADMSGFIPTLIEVSLESLKLSSLLYVFLNYFVNRLWDYKWKPVFSFGFGLFIFSAYSCSTIQSDAVYVKNATQAFAQIYQNELFEEELTENYSKELYGEFAPYLNWTKSVREFIWAEVWRTNQIIFENQIRWDAFDYDDLITSMVQINSLLKCIEEAEESINHHFLKSLAELQQIKTSDRDFKRQAISLLEEVQSELIKNINEFYRHKKNLYQETDRALLFLSTIVGQFWTDEYNTLQFANENHKATFSTYIDRLIELEEEESRYLASDTFQQ